MATSKSYQYPFFYELTYDYIKCAMMYYVNYIKLEKQK